MNRYAVSRPITKHVQSRLSCRKTREPRMCAPREFQVLAPARVSLSEAPELAEALRKLGPRSVVLKLGDQRSFYIQATRARSIRHIPGRSARYHGHRRHIQR